MGCVCVGGDLASGSGRILQRRRHPKTVREGPYVSIWGHSILGRWNSLCKGPEAGPCLECWESNEETCVAGTESVRVVTATRLGAGLMRCVGRACWAGVVSRHL